MRQLTKDELELVGKEMNDLLAKHGVQLITETKIIFVKDEEGEAPAPELQVAEENGGEPIKTKEESNPKAD